MINYATKQLILRTLIQNYERCGVRQLSAAPKPAKGGLAQKPDPKDVDHDYIGPPDTESNLRPYVRHIPKNETPLSKSLREKQIQVESWNQEFWARHNKRFYEEKEDFIKAHKMANIDEISADKMSKFYKAFLDKNRMLHFYYNLSWSMKNFDLLVLSAQVNIQKLWRKLRK